MLPYLISPLTRTVDAQQGDPIEERYKENLERGPVIDQLVYCINSYREAALSKDPKFDHIEIADKQKVGKHSKNIRLPGEGISFSFFLMNYDHGIFLIYQSEPFMNLLPETQVVHKFI